MAGGKETPRQKMIGMMYLVLTALLALNVTKEVVDAFVTINDKLDTNAFQIDSRIEDDYRTFQLKKLRLEAEKKDMTNFNIWNSKADSLKEETAELVSYILTECNFMIEKAEGKDWIAENGRDEKERVIRLNPLEDVTVKDNYDIPTEIFVGSDVMSPNERGNMIRERIHEFRDRVTTLMGTYTEQDRLWQFSAPESLAGLGDALSGANPRDTSTISYFYRSLTIPEFVYDTGEEKEIPWVSKMFNHAPIVAAAAMFTSLKVDVKSGEALAVDFMLKKINAVPYYINKIEPMPIAQSQYLNVGDSMNLNVVIAGYDSTEIYPIKYGMDGDTIPGRWKDATGRIPLDGASPGKHKVKGVIGVKEDGNVAWKPWDFEYTVGQPMAAISQPQQRKFYRGYDNEIEVAASGYPAESISVSVSNGSVVKQGNKWIVRPGTGIRKTTVSVYATNEDGSRVSIASQEFEVKPLPRPQVYLGGISSNQRVGLNNAKAQTRISVRYDSSVSLTGIRFDIKGGIVDVSGLNNGKGKVLPGGGLDAAAIRAIKQSSGRIVTITCSYTDPSGILQQAFPLVFNVR